MPLYQEDRFGGVTGIRTQKPVLADRRISNPLQYRYGTTPNSITTGRLRTYKGTLTKSCAPSLTSYNDALGGLPIPLTVVLLIIRLLIVSVNNFLAEAVRFELTEPFLIL